MQDRTQSMGESTSLDVSDAEILAVFAETDETPLTPRDVAADLPMDIDVLRARLRDLTERGLLERDDALRNCEVWYLTSNGEGALADSGADVVTDVEARGTVTGSQ